MVTSHDVPGLIVVPDAITRDEEEILVAWIDRVPPVPVKHRRRLDFYGDGAFNDGYGVGRRMGPIPLVLIALAANLSRWFELDVMPDAVSISEYVPGQGCDWHVDRPTAGPVIVGLSLLGSTELHFRRGEEPSVAVPYPPRTLMRIAGECRYAPWRHALPPVTERRISIVFRGDATSGRPAR